MNIDMNIINGIARAVLPALIAYLVGKGYLTQSSAGDVSAALITIIAAGWSVKSNTAPAAAPPAVPPPAPAAKP